jgi:hypothetical protein
MKKSYPTIDLDTAYEALQKLHDKLGNGPFDRTTVLKALNYSQTSGRGNNVISSLVHYGLIMLQSKKYYVTHLGLQSIENKSNVQAHRDTSISAFLNVALFDEMLKNYGETLPDAISVRNSLVHDYEVPDSKADSVIKNYIKSLNYILNAAKPKEPTNLVYKWTSTDFKKDTSNTAFSKKSNLDETIRVDFGDNLIADIPKRVILKAYLEELSSKLSSQDSTNVNVVWNCFKEAAQPNSAQHTSDIHSWLYKKGKK